ncbi:hypothetical protein E0Z10_g4070 [Xylaria hypoxylon]|uniref:Uncharacterized protein n=1 Tax=Xylaria hypoxylon TaxID=37992 RepID=A0A4Z0YM06_9PEZI|nr:hypothetical protein E0Z10_g4070 [Xylaria hypoxylon]
MSHPVDPTMDLWRGEWQRVCIQLDTFNCLIRISFDVYCRLGDGGRNFLAQQASTLLKKPVEFFVDNSNSTRVFLANRRDISSSIPCQLEQWTANGLPRLFPNPPPQQLMTNAAGNSTLNTHDVTKPSTSSNSFSHPLGSLHSKFPIQLGTPISETHSQNSTSNRSTRQSTPANMDYGRNLNADFANPWFPSTPSQGHGTPQTQNTLTSVGFMPTSNFNFPTPVGTQVYTPQSYSPFPQMNPPVNNGHTMNAGPSSSPKLISAKWGAMTQLEKDPYYEEADQLSLEQLRLHPNARYKANMAAIRKRQADRAARAAGARAQVEPAAQAQEQPQLQNGDREQPQQHIEQDVEPIEQVEHDVEPKEQVEHDVEPKEQVEHDDEPQELVQQDEQPVEQVEAHQQVLEPIEFPEQLNQQAESWEKKAEDGETFSFFDIFGDAEFNEEFSL